jgi:hypothetical protein
MRFKQYIDEAYVTMGRCSYYGTTFPIFVNPSPKEIRDAAVNNGSVRYCVALKEKDIFVWNMDMTHADASGYMEYEKVVHKDAYPGGRGYIWGVADIVGGKLVDDPSEAGGYYKNFVRFNGIDKITNDWTVKYFNPPLLDTMKAQAK